jgi:hypothetical protein
MYIETCAGRWSEAPEERDVIFVGEPELVADFSLLQSWEAFYGNHPINIAPLAGRKGEAGHRE